MLTAGSCDVVTERSTRKEPLTDREAQELLDGARRVLVARGRAVREVPAEAASLVDLKGPTGNYRAPLLASGETLLVGWHQATLEELIAS